MVALLYVDPTMRRANRVKSHLQGFVQSTSECRRRSPWVSWLLLLLLLLLRQVLLPLFIIIIIIIIIFI